MANNDKLLPCPFCAAQAEIYTGREYPPKKKRFANQKEAEQWVEENQQPDSTKKGVLRRSNRTGEYFMGYYDRPAYIPRCKKPRCPGRCVVMFKTEPAAIEAWNRRLNNGKA